jgi:TolB protein
MMGWRLLAAALFGLFAVTAHAQQGPLRIEIMEGVIEPLPFAIPEFQAETGNAAQFARDITRVVAADLVGTGLFREIAPGSFISTVTSFEAPVAYPDWRAINAQALITGAAVGGDGRIIGAFRLWDVFAQAAGGRGAAVRRARASLATHGHKVADAGLCAADRRGRLLRQPRGLRGRERAEERAGEAARGDGPGRRERAC